MANIKPLGIDTVTGQMRTFEPGDLLQGGDVTDKSKGTYTYTNAGGEQNVVQIITTTMKTIQGVWLDLSEMTQPGTVRSYYKIDGLAYTLVSISQFDPAIDSPGFFLDLNMGITDDFKITYQEGTDEGADRDVPFAVIFMVNE